MVELAFAPICTSAVEVTSPGHHNGRSSQTCRDLLEIPALLHGLEEDERPISFGDKSIMFIRLTLANANDQFNRRVPVTSTSTKQQGTLNFRVCRGIGATLIAAIGE
jgi:hypothetical protein